MVAQDVVQRLPDTLAALEAGRLDYLKARAIVEAVGGLDDEDAARVQTRVLARAEQQNLPALRRSLGRAVASVNPTLVQERFEQGLAERGVWATYREDGIGELSATAAADGITAVMKVLTALAGNTTPADERTIDQRRADTLIALGTATLADPRLPRHRRRRARVNVTVGLGTLLGDNDLPAELDGAGPIPASLARRIAADPTSTWRRLITDPHGHLLDYGHDTYRPPHRPHPPRHR
jgi:Domain of unknown function (DUF222)